MRHVFPDTPSGGKVEARAILARNNARGGNARPVTRMENRSLTRHSRGTLKAVLDELVTDGDAFTNDEGATYGLTDQGLAAYREHPNPRYLALPAEAGPEDE